MAGSTFQGPVRSLSGFYSQGPSTVATIAGSAVTLDVPNGLKHFVRAPLSNGMDGDFDTGNVRYKSRERYSFGWSDPLGMWGSSGST